MSVIENMQEQSPAESCLAQLQALHKEIGAAMTAISGNSLKVLEESLWRQEVLCTGLKRLLQNLETVQPSNSAMARVNAAGAALQALNRTYAHLVEQSRASNHLLYTLCCSYSDAKDREAAEHTGGYCSLRA